MGERVISPVNRAIVQNLSTVFFGLRTLECTPEIEMRMHQTTDDEWENVACSFEFGNLEPGKGLMATTDSTKIMLNGEIS